jgi:hypothetical protein
MQPGMRLRKMAVPKVGTAIFYSNRCLNQYLLNQIIEPSFDIDSISFNFFDGILGFDIKTNPEEQGF